MFGSLCTRWCRCLWLAQTGIRTAVGERGIGMKVREGVPVLNNRTDVSGFRKAIRVLDKIMTRENTARERTTMHSLASQRPARQLSTLILSPGRRLLAGCLLSTQEAHLLSGYTIWSL